MSDSRDILQYREPRARQHIMKAEKRSGAFCGDKCDWLIDIIDCVCETFTVYPKALSRISSKISPDIARTGHSLLALGTEGSRSCFDLEQYRYLSLPRH